MADIFISYAQEDRERVEPLAQALAAAGGWSIWWDREIPFGKPFDHVIEEALTTARCIIVVWSSHSIYSDWVIEEAQNGRQRNILIPILIDQVIPPFGFRRIQTANLTYWEGKKTFPEFQKVLISLTSILGPASPTSDHPEKQAQQEADTQIKRTPEEPIRSEKVANGSDLSARQKPPPLWWLRRRAVIVALLLLISGAAGFVLMRSPQRTTPTSSTPVVTSTPAPDTEAVRFYRLAADQGNALAQNNLGLMYRDGRGVQQDDTEAVRLFRLAADQGNADAQNNLGRMYAQGRGGLPKDDIQAVQWFRKAAEQGNAWGQNNLGWEVRAGSWCGQGRHSGRTVVPQGRRPR